MTAIAAADIADARPARREPKMHLGDAVAATLIGANGTKTLSTVTVPDPGFPYRILPAGMVGVEQVTAGRLTLSCTVNGNEVAAGRTGPGASSDAILGPPVNITIRTGESTVRLLATGNAQISGGSVQVLASPFSALSVLVIPA